MTTWFIADTHFRHKNILDFENRPFETLEEMEEKMTKAWNDVVAKTDTVYIVGDFCFANNKEWIEILDQLKGNIILVKGNHDKSKIIKRVQNEGYLSEIHEVGKLIQYDKLFFYVTHFPFEIGERPQYFNISGHIHSKESNLINQLNVGVDSKLMHDYYMISDVPFGTPVPFEYLIGYADTVNIEMQEKYVRGS